MNVCLIDVDSKIPNLALMKASTWHKSVGDSVKLGYDPETDHPDLCYVSKIFDFSPEPEYLPTDCEVIKGGSGYDYDRIMPDYDLFRDRFPKDDYAIGRFTRGCPNHCPWCIVWRMDGNEVRHVADLRDFWRGQRVVRLLDDNIMADEDEFVSDCQQLTDANVKAIWDALDIRLVTMRSAHALASVKVAKQIHFSWDGPSQDAFIEPGIDMLGLAGIKGWRLTFYVLVGFNTTPEYDMYRIEALRSLGVNPYVMPYDRTDPYQRHLARWCNNKKLFKSTSFDDYEPWAKHVHPERFVRPERPKYEGYRVRQISE